MGKFWTGEVEVSARWIVTIRPEDEFEDEAAFESALQQGRFEEDINYESQSAEWLDYDFELVSAEPEWDGDDEWEDDWDEEDEEE